MYRQYINLLLFSVSLITICRWFMDNLSLFHCSPEPDNLEPFPKRPSLQKKLAIRKMMKMLQNPWIEFQLSGSQPLRIFVAFMLFAQITIIFISNKHGKRAKGGMVKLIFFPRNSDAVFYEHKIFYKQLIISNNLFFCCCFLSIEGKKMKIYFGLSFLFSIYFQNQSSFSLLLS